MNGEYTDNCRFLIELPRIRNAVRDTVSRHVDILDARLEICKVYILKISRETKRQQQTPIALGFGRHRRTR